MNRETTFQRVFFLVLDSLGVGELPDAEQYNDTGANTIAHIARAVGGLHLPNLEQLGLGNLTKIKGISPLEKTKGSYGKSLELSRGKDTTTGHWEFVGIHTATPFTTFPEGFPNSFIEKFIRECKIPGVLGNKAASGTEIIAELGAEHLDTGKPIVYTSGDSVFQIACHEEIYDLKRLYKFCEVARALCDPLNVSRVIARPFNGKQGQFKRTSNRKDFSIRLPSPTMIDHIKDAGIETISIGKVASIYNHQGFTQELRATNNREVFACVLRELQKKSTGFIFANFVDFDMLYGHRRDAAGYAKELEWFDSALGEIFQEMESSDLFILSADHGNDPTAPGSDHTREYVPILAFSKQSLLKSGENLGVRSTFADIGQTILDAFSIPQKLDIGTSFLPEVTRNHAL